MSVQPTPSNNASRLRPLVPFVLGTLRRQPLQALVGLFGVALGVAVVVAIDLAADSARLANRTALESEAAPPRIELWVVPAVFPRMFSQRSG